MPRFGLCALGVLAAGCVQPYHLARDDSPTVLAHQLLTAPNPADPGPYRVRTLYYGSGKDRRRPGLREGGGLRTPTAARRTPRRPRDARAARPAAPLAAAGPPPTPPPRAPGAAPPAPPAGGPAGRRPSPLP